MRNSPKNILLASDDPGLRYAFSRFCEDHGIKVDAHKLNHLAIKAIQNGEFDMAIAEVTKASQVSRGIGIINAAINAGVHTTIISTEIPINSDQLKHSILIKSRSFHHEIEPLVIPAASLSPSQAFQYI